MQDFWCGSRGESRCYTLAYGYVNATYQDLRDTRRYEQNTTVANPTKGSRMPNIPYLMANAGVEFHKENLIRGQRYEHADI